MTSRKRPRKADSSTHSITHYLKTCPSPKRFKSTSQSVSPSPVKSSSAKYKPKLRKDCIEKLSNIHNLPEKYISDVYSLLLNREHMPYANKYAPVSVNEVHDTNVAGKIRDYLQRFVQCRYQENDTLIVLDDECNYALCVVGPPGAGKTSMVRIVTKSLGLGMLEVNTSNFRNRTNLIKFVKEATQTYSLASMDRSSSSVILIDDLDINLDEDKGFHAAVLEIMQDSKSPVILTCCNFYLASIPPEFKDRPRMRYLYLSSPSDSKLALKLDLINSIENNVYSSEEMRLLLYYTNYNLHAILTVLHLTMDGDMEMMACFEELFCQLDLLEYKLAISEETSSSKLTRTEVLYKQESFLASIHGFYMGKSSPGEYSIKQKFSQTSADPSCGYYRDMNIQGDITDYLCLSNTYKEIDKTRMSTRRNRLEDGNSFLRPVSTSIKFRA